MTQIRKKYIGDRSFYRRALGVILPIMLQNVVTNFVSLLDNIMVGQTGTASMSGVAVVGQLMFIFNLVVFGMVSGPGIFCAQFWGAGDGRSFKAAFRFKLESALAVCLIGMTVFSLWGRRLIGLYLSGSEAETAEIIGYAVKYMRIMRWGLIPYTVAAVYSSTLREVGRASVPMLASWAAVAVNLFLNWVLIFGNLGAPKLGVEGAAIATVVSRFAELGVNVVWSHTHGREVLFTQKMLEGFPVNKRLLRALMLRSIPLMLNETLWCLGSATLVQIYSTRGLEVVAAISIANVLWDLFTAVAFSVGISIGILVAQELGAGNAEKAVDTDRKLLVLGVALALAVSLVMVCTSGLFPRFYKTTEEIRSLAAGFICVMAAAMPVDCFAHGCYFTMRSGGKTLVTFLFDSCFSWTVNVPVAYVLAHHTSLGILTVYFISMYTALIKCAVGEVLVHKRYWVNTLTGG